jgi:hypothetical protein
MYQETFGNPAPGCASAFTYADTHICRVQIASRKFAKMWQVFILSLPI